MNFTNLLNTEKIVKEYSNLSINFNQSYLKSYPFFVNYFKDLKEIKFENLVISSHFTYGWMPTIIKLGEIEINRTIEILNNIKRKQGFTYEDIELIKKNINNSMVGASKLLHFINPDDFAIWDSRIVRYITENKYAYGIESHNNYIEYNYILKNVLCTDYKIQEIIKEIKSKIDPSISDLRAIELIIFEIQKQTSIK